MEKKMNSRKLPRTDSIHEMAQFWDTHDLTDFENDLEEVTEPVFERDTAITFRLHTSEAEAIRRIAKNKGMAETELVREWVLEKIQDP